MRNSSNKTEHLRADPAQVNRFLNLLDAQDEANRAADKRRATRFSYRADDLVIELSLDRQAWRRFAIPTRNISTGGIAFLLGQYVYPGTPCRVHLVTLHNQISRQDGKVIRTRYIEGAANLYEVGVKFNRPIDVAVFHRDAVTTELLLASSDPTVQRTVAAMFGDRRVRIERAEDAQKTQSLATERDFDLALCDTAIGVDDVLALSRELRMQGVALPIFAVTDRNRPIDAAAADAAGIDAVLVRPLTTEASAPLLGAARTEPMVSRLCGTPAMVPMIDLFVESIPSRLRMLQQALVANHVDDARQALDELEAHGIEAGFDAIAQSVRELRSVIEGSEPAGAVRSRLSSLVLVCRSARPVCGRLLTA